MPNTTLQKSQSMILQEIDQISSEMSGLVGIWTSQATILGILFYRVMSERQISYVNKKEAKVGNANFSFSALSNKKAERYRELIIGEKGFYICPSELFENVRNLAAGKHKLHEMLISIFKNIGDTLQGSTYERELAGVFDMLNANRYIPDNILLNLFNAIADLPIGSQGNSLKSYRKVFDSLMREFAFDLKNDGQMYYTPNEVSELLARIATVGKSSVDNVYDPTCGSGSLLLKFVEILGEKNIRNGLFGQDSNDKSCNFCRVNMILNNIDSKKVDIALGDSLSKPDYVDKQPFEIIVSNPPFSVSWKGDASKRLAKDIRFSPAGMLAPSDKADMAFVMHALAWLGTDGTAAILAYSGAMHHIGPEMKIRRYLIENNFVDAVIELPSRLFFGSYSTKYILVLKKNKIDNKVLFIDASNEFEKGKGLNKLNKDHIQKILECYAKREECDHFSRLVDPQEIADYEYKLSTNIYIAEYYADIIDIAGINAELDGILARKSILQSRIRNSIAILEKGF